jgi:hypothetical protein
LGVGILIAILCLNKQDSSITVAFDDIPEDGLNSPLRLEKLANEVLHFFFMVSIYKFSVYNCTTNSTHLAPFWLLLHGPLLFVATAALSYSVPD